MAAATERIPVLVSREDKEMIAQRAQRAQLSMGEYLRRAAQAFEPDRDNEMLEAMIEQVRKTTIQAEAAVDDALAFIVASNERIAALEAQRAAQPWA